MEEKLKELVEKFRGKCIFKNGKAYCIIPFEYSYGFKIHFKVFFPKKDLTFIYFDGKFDVWRVNGEEFKKQKELRK